MAGNSIKVSTQQVSNIAGEIEKLNQQLSDQLKTSKQTIDDLANIWQGDAASATISAFDGFATKYFQKYEEIIQKYVQFLRTNVDAGYTSTENENVKLADSFK